MGPSVPGLAAVGVDPEDPLEVHHLPRDREGHDAGDDLRDHTEPPPLLDAEGGRAGPQEEVGRVNAGLLDPHLEHLLGRELAEGRQDDQEERDLRTVAGGRDSPVDDAVEQREPVHVFHGQVLVLRVARRECRGVVSAEGLRDHDHDHAGVGDRHLGEPDHGQRHHREEGHEDRGGLDAPVKGVVALLVPEQPEPRDEGEAGDREDRAQHRRDLVALQAAHREGDRGRDREAADGLGPARGPDAEDVLDAAELDAEPLEDHCVEAHGEHEVYPELLQRVEEPDGRALGGHLDGEERLRRVGRERHECQHVHAEDAGRDQDVLPPRGVLLLEDRHQRQADGHDGPRGRGVADQEQAQEEEPAQLRARGHVELEEAHARDEHRHHGEHDELDVVHGVHVVQGVVDDLRHLVVAGDLRVADQAGDGQTAEGEEQGDLLAEGLDEKGRPEDDGKHSCRQDEVQHGVSRGVGQSTVVETVRMIPTSRLRDT